jgi:flagellar biosynthesis/type III secretory pathway protein FliH
VHLHPDDLSRCEGGCSGGAGEGLRFVADPEVAPGGCRVEGTEGVVTTDTEAQLREIAEALERVE